MSGSCDITGVSPGYGVRHFSDENKLPSLSDKFGSLNVQDRDQTRTYNYSLASDCSLELEPKSTATLDSLSLVDVEEILTEDEGSWLYSEKSSRNFSQDLGTKDKKITDEENDFGHVTQILGVLPLSTSNRDLSVLDRQEVVEILTPINNESEFPKLTSVNSSSNNNLLYGSGYIHVDINDVQNTAKLQEQSLRMSFSTPLVAKVVSLDLDEPSNMEKSKRKLKDQFQGNAREQNNLQNNRRSMAPQMSSLKPKTMPANKFSSSTRERPQGVPTKFSSSEKPLKVNCQSSPNINRQFAGRSEITRQAPPSHSTNVSSYQKSLPNLSRQMLTTTKSRPGDSTHRIDNSTQRKSLSIFSQGGPPIRTVSQPIVSSQMKTLRPQTQVKPSQKVPTATQSSRNLLTNSSQTRPIVARSITGQKSSLVAKEKQPQLSQRSSDTRNTNRPLSNLSTSIRLSTPTRQLPSTSKPASTINRSNNVGSAGLRTSTATTKTNLINSAKPAPASSLASRNPSNVSSLKSRNIPSTLPFQSRLSNATNTRTVNARSTSTPQRTEVLSKTGLSNSVQRSSTPINALGKNVSLMGTNRTGTRQLPSPVRSNIPMRLTQAHHPQEDDGWKEGCF